MGLIKWDKSNLNYGRILTSAEATNGVKAINIGLTIKKRRKLRVL